MKKQTIAGSFAILGTLAVGIISQLGDDQTPVPPALVAAKEYRQAILAESCSDTTERCYIAYDTGDYCACVTGKKLGEITKEVADVSEISDLKAFRFSVCKIVKPEKDKPNYIVDYFPVGSPDPSGYTCRTVYAKGPKEHSIRGIETKLDAELIAQCCADCGEDGCFVTPGDWGICPYCLANNDCSNHCLK
jgi:hypothetical protein